jgi:hypothetical protein
LLSNFIVLDGQVHDQHGVDPFRTQNGAPTRLTPVWEELTKDDLIEQVMDIITVGEFYAMAAGGEIIFT